MFKQLFLSAVVTMSLAIPVRAEWTEMSIEQQQSCVNHIHDFDQIKQEQKTIISNFPERGFGRDLTLMFAEYYVSTTLIRAIGECGGDYNAQQIADQMYRRGDIKFAILDDYLGL